MRRLILLAALACTLQAQRFDRIELRPRWNGGAYVPAVLKFCGSSGWPNSDPECVGLQAPTTVSQYDLFWPPAAPLLPSCIEVDEVGQMGFVACGAGVIDLTMGDAIMPATNPAAWSRQFGGAASDTSPYIAILAEVNERVQWTFGVPVGFTNQPSLHVWGEAGTDDEFEASLRCVLPNNNEDWNLTPFDSPNVGTWQSPGTSGLNKMVIGLTNNANIEPEEICQLDIIKSDGTGTSYYYHIQIK